MTMNMVVSFFVFALTSYWFGRDNRKALREAEDLARRLERDLRLAETLIASIGAEASRLTRISRNWVER